MTWSVEIELRLGALFLDVAMEGHESTVAIVGPNGAGKTTLLRTIAGAYSPQAGTVRVEGRELFHAAQKVNLPPEERRVGYVPQGFGLFPHLNVLENVAFGWRAQRSHMPQSARHGAAHELLKKMQADQLAERRPQNLSGGEKQRVSLARALMMDPQLLLLDEPFAALDITARRSLRIFLAEQLASHEIPAIVVTHDLRDILALNAYVYVLENGQVVQSGKTDELMRDPATEFVAEFFRSDSGSI